MIVRLKKNGDFYQTAKKPKMNDPFNGLSPKYTKRIKEDAQEVSKLFREKVATDLVRALGNANR